MSGVYTEMQDTDSSWLSLLMQVMIYEFLRFTKLRKVAAFDEGAKGHIALFFVEDLIYPFQYSWLICSSFTFHFVVTFKTPAYICRHLHGWQSGKFRFCNCLGFLPKAHLSQCERWVFYGAHFSVVAKKTKMLRVFTHPHVDLKKKNSQWKHIWNKRA